MKPKLRAAVGSAFLAAQTHSGVSDCLPSVLRDSKMGHFSASGAVNEFGMGLNPPVAPEEGV